ncbi:MAG TPA: pseudouridine synthase [Candidatus Paceibacterota bacterium]|nr:pseudouridine synthase [Candidatus Paceibacterota bacterium]
MKPRTPITPAASAPLWPMRINKYLAQKGYSTRRGADTLIAKGQVSINGRKAVLGDVVNETDKVICKNSPTAHDYMYVAFYKPKGIITHSPQGDETDIKELVSRNRQLRDLFPVGRLDKASHGLIILTNDGRITDRLLSPDKIHEKEYAVETVQNLRPSFAEHMEKGVELEDCVTKPCKVHVNGEKTFRITITEGKKHQIRRMVSAMHNEVADIKRIRIMNIKLGNMKPGEARTIAGNERKQFLESLGLIA